MLYMSRRVVIFKALAISAPFLLLLLLELVLRLFNYGNDTRLFVKYPPDMRFLVMNVHASEKFFPDTVNSTVGNQEPFAIDKSPNTFRIFVLGESTTLGYPFNPNGSFHRWLQYRLMQEYPDKNFEVINLALTAVNSYTVLDFGRQLPAWHPDAVLIYTGHNEYYGALGIGSTTSMGNNRWLVQALIKLRTFRVVQLFNNCIRRVAGLFSGGRSEDHRSLMEIMAAKQHIAYGSAAYRAGIDQFDRNMTELCGILNEEKIPVFLSTVVSNEKDLPPFVSEGKGPGSARGYYDAGRLDLKNSDADPKENPHCDSAREDFLKAKELDELRFRAPEAINTVIRRLAGQYPFVHLVDTQKWFEQYAECGIIGKETMMEHVHPNLLGYAIMAEAYYRVIRDQRLIGGKPARELSFDQLRKEMPITRMDSLKGVYEIMMLRTGWPFDEPINPKFKVDSSIEASLAVKVALGRLVWTSAMGELFRYYKKEGNKLGAMRVAEAMVLQYPQKEDFYGFAGGLSADLQDYGKAAFYYGKLFMLNHDPQLQLTAVAYKKLEAGKMK